MALAGGGRPDHGGRPRPCTRTWSRLRPLVHPSLQEAVRSPRRRLTGAPPPLPYRPQTSGIGRLVAAVVAVLVGLTLAVFAHGLCRSLVAAGSPADGRAIGELELSEDAWISLVGRDGQLIPVQRATTLRAGDQVIALTGPEHTRPHPGVRHPTSS